MRAPKNPPPQISLEIHIQRRNKTLLVGRLFSAERGNTVCFEYPREWLLQHDCFAIDPTLLPLSSSMFHT
jgi:hypothetical protein